MDALYGYEAVNVEAQPRDPHSLLNWMRRMLAVRRAARAFGRGALRLLYPKNRKVLAYLREYEDDTILCVANVSRTPQAVELDLSEFAGRVPVELDGGSMFPPIGQLTYLLTLPPYGFYWFVLADEEAGCRPGTRRRPSRCPNIAPSSCATGSTMRCRPRARVLERETLPAYLPSAAGSPPRTRALRRGAAGIASRRCRTPSDELLLAEVETETHGAAPHAGSCRWRSPGRTSRPARCRRSLRWRACGAAARVGLLTDAFALPEFARGAAGLRPTARC